MEQKKWIKKYLTPLVGGTITRVGCNSEEYPTITVKVPGEMEPYLLEISQDEEGNGPGFVFGLPMPKQPAH